MNDPSLHFYLLLLGSFLSACITMTFGNLRISPSYVKACFTLDPIHYNLQLAQLLFYENGTVYNQSLILNSNYEVDPTLLAEQGLPYYAGTWVVLLLVTNMSMAATFTHLLLWNRDDLRLAWSWMAPSNLRKQWQEFRWKNVNWKIWEDDGMREQSNGDKDIDPHYAQMLKVSPGVSVRLNKYRTNLDSSILIPRIVGTMVLSWYHL